MRSLLVAFCIIAVTVRADYDDYRTSPRRPPDYSTDSGSQRQMSLMNTRLSFLQIPRIAPTPAQRYETWKHEPLVQTAPPPKPDTFMAFLGRAIKQNMVEVGRAMVAAVVRPFQAIKQMVTGLVQTFSTLVSQRVVVTPPVKGPQNVHTPAPPASPHNITIAQPQERPKPITTPISNERPVHNITMPTPQSPTVTTKGPGLIDKARQIFHIPRHVPTNQLYLDPASDVHRRGGFDDEAIRRRRNEMINGRFEPISVIKTPQGYKVSDGDHRFENATRMKYPTVPVYIIGREK